MKRILLLLILYGTSTSYAQLTGQNDRKYHEAVGLYNQGRYEQAMERLRPLTSSRSDEAIVPYAHYYYALAAHKLNKYQESNLMLRQLLSRYGTWERKDEAYYLLGANSLSLGQLNEGLDYLKVIGDANLGKDVQGLKQFHLAQVKDLPRLKVLQKEFPSDRVVAEALVSLIQKVSTDKADLELSDRLTNRFNIDQAQSTQPADRSSVKSEPKASNKWEKGYFNVSVLLPFRLEEFHTAKRTRSNQYAYDFYEGMQLARQQLKNEGVLINLYAYDISNEEDRMLNLLNNALFRQSDLIMGPLYPKTYALTAQFSAENNVLMVNPLATDGTLLEGSPYAYLAHPSISYQMQQAAQLARSLTPRLAAAIYYGSTPKDSAMANAYEREVLSKGGKVLQKVMIGSQPEAINTKMSFFQNEKPTHLLLASTDARAGAAFMSVLDGRELDNVPVIATASSFDFQRSRPHSYGNRLHLIETDYVDISKESIRRFQKQYFEATNTLPSVYSYQGYDQLLFFGRMVAKYKDKLPDGLGIRRYDEDYLLSGFDFTKARENQITPILKYNDARWVPIR
ncbi:hypothetical protein GCM10027275_17200 [Rhabdobacter roseus]|uniref:ABC-type branched-subunit amino acid transport system substrate-binding protein n=1 Tax=Rhabdobacter roseus TaxID=1655419 RepID=A0A840TJP1_9BACT|nr:ABC transporter substrate-binding protein [Rhabdobacter roseus]MBB5283644.1 ABC-type branched-subunit amino acid transport system substrate-binding protein [Rhabdobacter roseus]